MCLIRCNAVAVFCLLHWFVVANKNNILSGSYSDQIHDGNEYIGVQGWDRDKLSTSMPIDNVQSSARVLKLPEKIARVKLSSKPNLLFIVSDQLRFDAIRLIQDRRSDFEGFTKINTPSLDRLAKSGIVFDTAYCVSPSCAPSRTAGLKAGVSLQRSGIKGNGMVDEHVYRRMQMVEDKVEQLESLEQLLVEEEGYTAETYGKWHVPISVSTYPDFSVLNGWHPWLTIARPFVRKLYYRRGDVNKEYPIISNNVYDFKDDRFLFRPDMQFKPVYKRDVEYLVERDGVDPGYRKGQQEVSLRVWMREPLAITEESFYCLISRFGMLAVLTELRVSVRVHANSNGSSVSVAHQNESNSSRRLPTLANRIFRHGWCQFAPDELLLHRRFGPDWP